MSSLTVDRRQDEQQPARNPNRVLGIALALVAIVAAIALLATNPHLLVNNHSAHTTATVSESWMGKLFRGLPLTAAQLREDRILEEARCGRADPLHLAAVFGFTPRTGLRYTQAGNYTDCTRIPAAGFRIYPPEDTASLFLAQPRDACSNAGINLLIIGAFQAR